MNIGELLFKIRGYTPIPFLLAAIILANPKPDLAIFGLLLILFGEFMRLWGVSYAGGATRTRDVGASQLVTNGPFAFLRNPLYVGNILMYTGASILTGGWLPYMMFLIIIFFSIQYVLIVRLEEKKLKELFGAEYEKYQKSVPRFLPRISPYPGRTKIKPDFAGALRSERSTFQSMLIFLVVFAGRWYFMTM